MTHDYIAYDTDGLSDTVGVYRYSDEHGDWHRVRTLPSAE